MLAVDFWARPCLFFHLDAGHDCVETMLITQEISRAKSGSSTLLHYNRRPCCW